MGVKEMMIKMCILSIETVSRVAGEVQYRIADIFTVISSRNAAQTLLVLI
jgi:hypothetical protein